MIEAIAITIAANYVIFTLGWFSITCKHWLNLAELHHKHTVEFELQQAEAIIREEAVNLAREIDNLTKKDAPKTAIEMYEFVKEVADKTKAKKIEVVGFGQISGLVALTTTCYSPDAIKLFQRPNSVVSIEEFCSKSKLLDGGLSVQTL